MWRPQHEHNKNIIILGVAGGTEPGHAGRGSEGVGARWVSSAGAASRRLTGTPPPSRMGARRLCYRASRVATRLLPLSLSDPGR